MVTSKLTVFKDRPSEMLLQRWKHTDSLDVISGFNLFSDYFYVKHTELGFQGL